MADQDSKCREQTFWDNRFEAGAPSWLQRMRDAAANPRWQEHYEDAIVSAVEGRRALDYGCGTGWTTAKFACHAEEIVGIDISDTAIEQAADQAEAAGLTNVAFEQMDAENLDFDDDSFDAVYGSAIIHHLDVRRALSEICRVLKPSGMAVFEEPMGHNLGMRAFRALTPNHRTPDEHPLLVRDLQIAEEFFADARFDFFNLSTLLAVPFALTPLADPIRKILARVDDRLIDAIPALGPHAWRVVLVLGAPEQA